MVINRFRSLFMDRPWTLFALYVIGTVVYNYLAGGTLGDFWLTLMFAWVGIIAMYIVYVIDERKDSKPRWFFWAVGMYLCSPIIMNGISMAMNYFGFPSVAGIAFWLRFPSLVIVIVILLGTGFARDYVVRLCKKYAGRSE